MSQASSIVKQEAPEPTDEEDTTTAKDVEECETFRLILESHQQLQGLEKMVEEVRHGLNKMNDEVKQKWVFSKQDMTRYRAILGNMEEGKALLDDLKNHIRAIDMAEPTFDRIVSEMENAKKELSAKQKAVEDFSNHKLRLGDLIKVGNRLITHQKRYREVLELSKFVDDEVSKFKKMKHDFVSDLEGETDEMTLTMISDVFKEKYWNQTLKSEDELMHMLADCCNKDEYFQNLFMKLGEQRTPMFKYHQEENVAGQQSEDEEEEKEKKDPLTRVEEKFREELTKRNEEEKESIHAKELLRKDWVQRLESSLIQQEPGKSSDRIRQLAEKLEALIYYACGLGRLGGDEKDKAMEDYTKLGTHVLGRIGQKEVITITGPVIKRHYDTLEMAFNQLTK